MENNEYVIRIVNGTESDAQAVAQSVGGAGGINAQQSGTGGGAIGTTTVSSTQASGRAAKALAGLFSVGTMVNTVKQGIGFAVSQVSVETGSREEQQKASALYSVGTSLAGIVGVGIAGGPAMAGVALLGMLISKTTSLIMDMRAIENQTRVQDVTRNMSAQRVTVSGSRYMNAGEF